MRTNCYSDRVNAHRLGFSHTFGCNLIFMLLVAYCAMLILIAYVHVCYCFDCLGLSFVASREKLLSRRLFW